jgi:HSP20 family molecular chaperone IbpA
LPGVEDLDIEIIDGTILQIKAERKYIHKVDTDIVHSIERSFGKVQRSFSIPQNGNYKNIKKKFLLKS